MNSGDHMDAGLPEYYSTLAPFQKVFESGTPILTYHKLGPRPRGARLKGLYVSARLFRRQLKELSEAGFRSGSLESAVSPLMGKQTVVTFDDAYRSVATHGMEALRAQGFRAVLFVVADQIGGTNEWDRAAGEVPEPLMDESELRDWLREGHEIGAHTCTHVSLTKVGLERAKEEIVASRKKLEDRLAIPIRHFCYPYGDWNRPVLDLVQEAGYQTACTTDPGINQPGNSPFLLKRFTARYRSRSLKTFWAGITGSLRLR